MEKSELKDRRYRCKTCNKNYSSASSLWNHNNNFHNEKQPKTTKKQPKNNQKTTKKQPLNNELKRNNLICKFCNKIFYHYNNRWRHEKTCKIKEENEILKSKTTNNTTNNNITNNNTTNNGTINNITINAFGSERIDKFPVKELKKFIRNDNYLYNIIEYINFNEKYPENHSFCSTSLEGKYISKLNPETNKIEKISKDRFLDTVYETANEKIDNILFEIDNNKDFRNQFKEKYINHLRSKYEHIYDLHMRDCIYKKKYKTDINQLSYNKKDLIQNTWSKIKELDKVDESIEEEYLSDSTLKSEIDSNYESETESDDINLSLRFKNMIS
jgi:hypothetical protein